jgi:hypothetical protein
MAIVVLAVIVSRRAGRVLILAEMARKYPALQGAPVESSVYVVIAEIRGDPHLIR